MSLTSNIFLSLLGCAFFSGMEIAYVSADRLRIELDKKQGRLSSKIITVFIIHPVRYLTTMLMGNIISLVIFCVFLSSVQNVFLSSFMIQPYIVLFIQILISAIILILFAGFLPKLVFMNYANSVMIYLSIPAFVFYLLFLPFTLIFEKLSYNFQKSAKNDKGSQDGVGSLFNKVDLLYLMNQSNQTENKDNLQTDEIKLFQNALDFSSVRVRDCMIPRTEIAALSEDSGLDDFRNMYIETGFSKILVYQEKVDNIIGYMTSKSLFAATKNKKLPIIPVLFVPETMPANRLLKKLIQEKKSIAVVVDEFGGVAGMLTIEDIIEEIFGEIEDEYDTSELIEKQLSESEFIFSGRLEIDYLNETYHLQLPESEEYETLAGYILYRNESIPKLNDKLFIDNFEIKINKVSNTKVELVSLTICR